MHRFREGIKRIEHIIVRCFAWFFHSPITDSGEFELSDGTSVEVSYFSSPNSLAYAQKVPFTSTIILNEARFSELSQGSKEFVLLHEHSHLNRHPVGRGAFWGGILLLVIFLAKVLKAILLIGAGLATGSILLLTVLAAILSILITLIVRLEETIAEIQTLRGVGETTYLNSHREIRESSTPSTVDKVRTFALYPKPETVVKLERYF